MRRGRHAELAFAGVTRVLALDIGTTKVRAVGFDGGGRTIEGAVAKRKHDAGDDPDRLAAAAEETLAEGRRTCGEVAAVATSCFWHSLLAVDGRGRPLTPILGWRNVDAADDAEELARRLDPAAVHARTGCVLHPSYWPAKLAWLRRTRPDAFAGAARFVSFAEYLYERLAGRARTSVSMASGTGLLDLARGDWDDELLDALALDAGKLPEIGDEPVGEAEPWYPALGDGACSNVGIGCVTRERAALTIGTSAAYRTVYDARRAQPRPGLFVYRLDARRYVEGGSFSDGDNLLFWLRDRFRLPDADVLADRDPDAHGLTFLPLLGGERAPGWNARARGAVAGLDFDTTAADVLQAALEGLAYRFAEVADRMPEVETVVATGGVMVQEPSWLQLLADVLGRPVAASDVDESSARGAAVVALERLGEAPEEPSVGRAFEPRAERAAVYRHARERQRELYDAVT